MFDAELYNSIYNFGMLLTTVLTLALYMRGGGFIQGYNVGGAWVAGIGMVLFLGTRPVSGVFVDMLAYSRNYQVAASYGLSQYPDWLFNVLVNAMAPNFPEVIFFVVCALIYVVPICLAATRRHGTWALALILAFYGSFSFFAFGTNGLRNGMSSSLLIAAFAWSDNLIIMGLLMAAAAGMHNSALLPIAVFLATWLWSRPWSYWLLWLTTLVFVTATGSRTSDILINYLPGGGDDQRLESYIGGVGNDRGGYRLDFILYSIVPVLIAYIFAKPATRSDRFYQRLVCTYLGANTFWLLTMYAAFSNRFAYLSWFMMPWVIAYPFLPTQTKDDGEGGRLPGLLGAALLAHFAFTFLMLMYVYAKRVM